MTEQEWLTCLDPRLMLQNLKVASDRHFRLFACACVRHIWQLLDDERPRLAVILAEGFADGMVSRAELKKVCSRTRSFAEQQERQGHWTSSAAVHAAHQAAYCNPKGYTKYESYGCTAASLSAVLAAGSAAKAEFRGSEGNERYAKAASSERAVQANILRDIVGNPFRSVAFAESWRHPDVVSLAKIIHEEGLFDRMPFLADALELVGCGDADILSHCRKGSSHVRGCWVVDLVLGKV